MIDRIQPQTWLFLLVLVSIASAALLLTDMLQSLQHPEAMAFGLTLDLTLVMPLAYYVLILRPRGRSPIAVAPAVVLGFVLAAVLLPREHQGTLHALQVLAIPAEVGLALWLGARAIRALKRVRRGNVDPLEALNEIAGRLVGSRRVASIIASEMAVVYFAIGSWGRKDDAGVDTHAVPSRQSGHGGLVFALLLMIAVEGIAVHFLLSGWNPMVAWVVTVITLYGALWLVADYRATVLRPVLVDSREVCVRAGLRWFARVPRAAIAGVSRTRPESGPAVSIAFVTQPNSWIFFSEPVLLQGPYGITRLVRSVGLFADSPATLREMLASKE